MVIEVLSMQWDLIQLQKVLVHSMAEMNITVNLANITLSQGSHIYYMISFV